MGRHRKAVAVACIALVALVAILPLGAVSLEWIVVPAAVVLLQPLIPAVTPPAEPDFEAPDAPFLSPLESRGPPSASRS